MRVRVYVAFLLLSLLAACGDDDLVIGGTIVRPTVAPTRTPSECREAGEFCTSGADCCSSNCNIIVNECSP